jgi:alginate O-acetyltransferase complex protein AlgI
VAFLSAPFFAFVVASALVTAFSPARLRPRVLMVASLVFYTSGDPRGAALLVALTAFVYWAGLRVGAGVGNWPLLAIGLAGLFGVLLLFKAVQGGLSAGGGGQLAHLVMPLGLSYFVFKLASYLVDVYWKRRPAERTLGNLILYALFFPQIVSGPIQRAGHFFDQLGSLRVDTAGVDRGLRLIVFGLLQKLIADHIGIVVSAVYGDPAAFSPADLLIGLYAFAFQLYLDFAGITDIAIGLGALFGLKTPQNFDRPFFATNIQEFWRRWHMTLSFWLVDYLFTPLWHSLRNWRTFGLTVAILANMLAIGLWHGARWTFVVFGLLNGILMTVSVLSRKRRSALFNNRPRLQALRGVTSRIVTFHVVAAFFVFVRADSLSTASAFFRGLVAPHALPASRVVVAWVSLGVTQDVALALLGCVAACEVIHWLRQMDSAVRLVPLGRGPAIAAAVGLIVYMVLCRDSVQQEFLYAQF